MKDYQSGTKPRFDGKGSLFGDIHRELPPGTCMFDIDRMLINMETELWLQRENTCFVEYRQKAENISFVAVFETKHKYSDKAFDLDISSNRARLAMSRQLGCRLFIVFYSEGLAPLDFYEINIDTGKESHAYHLIYDKENRAEKVRECWKALGLAKL